MHGFSTLTHFKGLQGPPYMKNNNNKNNNTHSNINWNSMCIFIIQPENVFGTSQCPMGLFSSNTRSNLYIILNLCIWFICTFQRHANNTIEEVGFRAVRWLAQLFEESEEKLICQWMLSVKLGATDLLELTIYRARSVITSCTDIYLPIRNIKYKIFNLNWYISAQLI